MLSEVLSTILVELNRYVHGADDQPPGSPDVAILGNIALRDDQAVSADLDNKLVLTLVNLEEEPTLKNGHALARSTASGVSYVRPPAFLNLFLVFSANYKNYTTALTRLGQVITFFQGKGTFTPGNSPGGGLPPTADVSLTLSLVSLTLEQLNHLWGSLGGKQLPFVMYCGRLIMVQEQRLVASGGRIEQIDIIGRGSTH
jgi:hypothetical protein